ncbi:zinc finger and SCAN domain-containing protein 2-like [Parambassis ranga]|uniref:Zinc finger and SCAN domain-containing protein 2-like n=1 Tax=Parambassis ranga TaxID=210632 RepID=A0A6P7JYY5_9TELE|nr:zinc finger and SCAN domain-containing protein 2-like [Parambassis ranga]
MSRSFQQLKESFRRRLLAAAHEHLLEHFQRTISGYEAELEQKRNLLDLLSDPDKLRTGGLPPDILWVSKEQQGWSFSPKAADGAPRPADPPSLHGPLRGGECPHSEAPSLHLKTPREENTHSCSVCGKKFTRRVELKYHVLIHTGLRPYRRFRWLGQVRAQRHSLQIRIRSHARERPLSCTVYRAKRHTCAGVWVTEDPPPTQKKPPWTGATYRRKKKGADGDGGQNRQQRDTNSCHGVTGTEGKRHSDQSGAQKPPDIKSEPQTEEPRNCSACGKRLTPESAGHRCVCEEPPNRQSQSGHAGKEPLSCSICSAAFWDRDSLVLHMRSHARLTRFTCPVCTKDFVWRRHLTKHMEVHQNHSGGAPAQNKQGDSSDCDTDDSDFWTESRDVAGSRRRSQLKVHTAAHQEQRSQSKQAEVKEEQEEAQISTFNLLSVKTEEEEKPPCGPSGDPPESDDSVDSDFWKDDRKRPSALS